MKGKKKKGKRVVIERRRVFFKEKIYKIETSGGGDESNPI